MTGAAVGLMLAQKIAAGAGADVAVVQTGYNLATTVDAVVTLGAAVTSGNTVVLVMTLYDDGASNPGGTGLSGASVTPPDTLFDNQSNSYTLQYKPTLTENTNIGVYFYVKTNITNGPTVFTLHDSSSRTVELLVIELSGVNNAAPMGYAGGFTTKTTNDTAPIHSFAATAGDLAITVCTWAVNGSGTSVTANSPWVEIGDTATTSTYTGYAYAPYATGGTKSTDITLGANESWEAIVVTLKK